MRELNQMEAICVSGCGYNFVDRGHPTIVGESVDWDDDGPALDNADTTTDTSATEDYCGTAATAFIPDKPLGNDFSGACKAHDECYGQAIVSRATCDSQFLSDMQKVCGGDLICNATAGVYYVGVRLFGGGAYGNQ